jgi:flagellar biosynthesis protein FlhF
MQIKRFEAKTMTGALKAVKDEFGPDAVILSARTLRRSLGFFGASRSAGVELTAAVDFEWPASVPAGRRATSGEALANAPVEATSTARRGILHNLNESLRSIAGRRSRPTAAGLEEPSPVLADLQRHWLAQDVPQDITAEFSEHLQRLPDYDLRSGLDRLQPLAVTVLHDMGLRRFVAANATECPHLTALVGPSGTGKTTLAMKLAVLESVKMGRRVALLSLDDRRIGAGQQVRIYAEILGVPWGVAGLPSDAQALIDEWASMERIIIDTPGVSPGEVERRAEVQALLDAVKCREVHLVLNAGFRKGDLMPVVEAWKSTPVSGLAFTRLDETNRYGSLLETAMSSRLPLSWLSTGPRIPEDVTDRSVEQLVDRLWPQRRVLTGPSVHAFPIEAPKPAASYAAGPAFVANRNSDLYHRIDCKRARKIKQDHLLQFSSAAEAESRNFHACRSCCPARAASSGADRHSMEPKRLFG